MTAKYKLVVSDTAKFTVRLALLDDDKERVFLIRVQAKRLPQGTTLESAVTAHPIYAEFLAQRGLTLLGWDGDAPLRDDEGKPAPADADALAALLAEQSVAHAFFIAYVDAIGGKAKLGN